MPPLVAFQKARPFRDSTISAELGTRSAGEVEVRPLVARGLPSLMASEGPTGPTGVVSSPPHRPRLDPDRADGSVGRPESP